jgi:hypothetical protein
MDAKEILKKIKAVFHETQVLAPAPVVPAPQPVKLATNYPVDGGQPVYVDTSDDGLNDIDTGDAVYSDEAMTQPYADGTFTVTGTSFSFTVAGGIVTATTGTLDTTAAPAAAPAAAAAPLFLPALRFRSLKQWKLK